ncbi:N-acetyltransferase [Georhizobium profundi]|uniref:N-acetyltransferase n=2 Tax=Georhizobium profundi TaxID=2341112 RepID=A0A3Q8XSA9_9HYPH|nr:GNAT family N-acetyltransferase [Georhizobium profundi]AZN73805.1 N-acetyltransferase [Georhizobium profundi]
MADVERSDWDKLAGTTRASATADIPYNPFLSYDFLSALEQSGSVAAKTGWLPRHLLLKEPDGTLCGAVPAYLKSHSQGEYVFDHGWADAFERAGGEYYPKLQASIPFTPATGPRLLAPADTRRPVVQTALAQGLIALTDRLGISSAHITFIPEGEMPTFEETGFLHRTDQQFHFHNESYASYDDFLATLASRKRKALKRERQQAVENGISIERLTGASITEEHWDAFYAFYIDTGARKWGRPYLNRAFFSLIGQTMADDILLVMAKREGRYIAGAINFIGGDCVFGRHWGCIEDHAFLHFEVCYHQAIDFAIERGLPRVEAGAQGEHKLARGYLPVTTHSAHYIAHPGLKRAVADYLERERREVDQIGAILTEHGPFKKA